MYWNRFRSGDSHGSVWRLLVTGLLAGTLLAIPLAAAGEIESSLARGGRLYDKWFKVVKAETPTVANPSYPDDGKYKGKKGADWRCKECHGWDYKGKDGAYSEGKHFTGISGIRSFDGADPARIVAVLKDDVHGYTDAMMDESDFQDLAIFVSKGQIDMDRYIDRSSKAAKGDVGKGEAYYNTLCASCHGLDGTKIKDMDPMGKVVTGNPWEALHKVLNGQPAEQMPALRALDHQIAVDVLAHAQTLPKER